MKTISRPAIGAIAITLAAFVLASCATANPSDVPSASASAQASASLSPSAQIPSASPSIAPSSAPTATLAPTPKPGALVVSWHRSGDVAAPNDSWWAWAGGGRGLTWTKLGKLYVMPVNTDGYDSGPQSGPQIWLSEDLLHWHRAAIAQPANQHLTVRAVTLGGPGLVALGTDTPDDVPMDMWWTSTDGETWKQTLNESDTGLTPGQLWLLRATAGGSVSYDEGAVDVTQFHGTKLDPDTSNRIIEAAGDLTVFTDSAQTNQRVEIWQAVGTGDWKKAGTLPKSKGATVLIAAHGPRGYFLMGCGADCSNTVGWTSPNGVTWLTSNVVTFDGVNAILADQTGFVAVGQRVTGKGCVVAESDIYGESWTSSDGRTWRKMKDVAQFNHASVYVLIPRNRALFGIGMRWASDHAVPTVWTATLPVNSVASGPGSTPTPAPGGPGGCGD